MEIEKTLKKGCSESEFRMSLDIDISDVVDPNFNCDSLLFRIKSYLRETAWRVDNLNRYLDKPKTHVFGSLEIKINEREGRKRIILCSFIQPDKQTQLIYQVIGFGNGEEEEKLFDKTFKDLKEFYNFMDCH